MRIWLDQVREAPFNWDETEGIAITALDRPELLELSPVSWNGRVTFCDPGFMLEAQILYEQTLACNRCLKSITLPTELRVELAIETGERKSAGEHSLHESDLGILYVDGRVFETDPILVEQLQLNVPMKPLCRPDCRGFCPQCGADLNESSCNCATSTGDTRWAALRVLRGNGNENKES
jgi:uncharacterized protein